MKTVGYLVMSGGNQTPLLTWPIPSLQWNIVVLAWYYEEAIQLQEPWDPNVRMRNHPNYSPYLKKHSNGLPFICHGTSNLDKENKNLAIKKKRLAIMEYVPIVIIFIPSLIFKLTSDTIVKLLSKFSLDPPVNVYAWVGKVHLVTLHSWCRRNAFLAMCVSMSWF